MKTRKILLTILVVVLILTIITGIWAMIKHTVDKKVALRNINVASLTGEKENNIKTIYYPGGKVISDTIKENNDYKMTIETTDSLEGATAIYYQDLLNRYKNYDVSKKSITKDDALDNKATVLVCSGETGKITMTLWPKANGMTEVNIVTSADFK